MPKGAINIFVGNRIRDRRRLLGLSRAQVAERAKVQLVQLGRYETADIDLKLSVMSRIAKAIGVTPNYLLEGFGASTETDEARNIGIEAVTVARTFSKINNPKLRRVLADHISILAKENGSA